MLGFVQNWFTKPPHPIGIDWDGSTLRLAQVESAGEGFALRAAACKRWPGQPLRADNLRELLDGSNFAGRDAIFIPPASLVQLFTLDANPENLSDASDRLTRSWPTASGETLISSADRSAVAELLQTLADAGLAVAAVALLPSTINDLCRRLFRRSHEVACTSLHIHLGESATTCFITQAGDLRHVEQCEFGRQAINRAACSELDLSPASADALRERLLHAAAPIDWDADRTLIHRPAVGQVGHPLQPQAGTEASDLCREAFRLQVVAGHAVRPLIERLKQLCTSFTTPIDRLIFSGSEAMDRPLCERIARELQLPAHVADPILRMRNRASRELAGGMDRRLPQPAWAAVIGASMGTLARQGVRT